LHDQGHAAVCRLRLDADEKFLARFQRENILSRLSLPDWLERKLRIPRADWREPRGPRHSEPPGLLCCDCGSSPSSPSSGGASYSCLCAGNPITLPATLTCTVHSAGCPGLDGQTVTLHPDTDAADFTDWAHCTSFGSLFLTLWRGDATLCSDFATTILFGCMPGNICPITSSPPNTNFRSFDLFVQITRPDQDGGDGDFECGTSRANRPSCIYQGACACASSTCSPFVLQFGKSAGCSNGGLLFLLDGSNPLGGSWCGSCCNNSGGTTGPFANTDDLSFTITE
jgi:hypothetical protein